MSAFTKTTALPPEQRVHVALDGRSYEILVGAGLLNDASAFSALAGSGSALFVTNTTVGPLYLGELIESLRACFSDVSVVTLPDGEEHKHWPVVEQILDALVAHRSDRRTTIIALGGGVVGDVSGFAASCYMRGIDFVQVPTTLLAQVDSSVGGKTAINHALGKNLIGAFHQPKLVVADVALLGTLPRRELVAGMAEVIKYGAVLDADFLDWIEAKLESVLALEPAALTYAVRRSCEIKARVVAADEFEAGQRAFLNFGHTVGHAIEAGTGYGTWHHGEAVACGMVVAAELSRRRGMLATCDAARLRALLIRAGLPTVPPTLPPSQYLELMGRDKKNAGGALNFVLLESLGHATVQRVDDDEALAAIAACAAAGYENTLNITVSSAT